jgi:hypothetical protein
MGGFGVPELVLLLIMGVAWLIPIAALSTSLVGELARILPQGPARSGPNRDYYRSGTVTRRPLGLAYALYSPGHVLCCPRNGPRRHPSALLRRRAPTPRHRRGLAPA